jgi:hypothetical protein
VSAPPPEHRLTRRLAAGLAGAYLALVAAFALLRHATGWPQPDALASSPAGVAAGNVWALITSGLVVAGDPLPQLVGTGLTALLVVELLGAPAFWAAALAAHVGSALIAYVGVGVMWLVARADVDAVVAAPDYGISCVWAGAAGALAGGALGRRPARERTVAIVGLGVLVAGLARGAALAGVEHGLSFCLGAFTVIALDQRAAARARGRAARISAPPSSAAQPPASSR